MTDKYEALRQDLHDAGEYFGFQNPAPRVKVIQDLLADRDALAERVATLVALLRRIPHFNNVPGYTTGSEIDAILEAIDAAQEQK